MSRRYFGTDGVRGKVGVAPITPDFVMRLGNAAGQVLVRRHSHSKPRVLIGKDTRVSGYLLEAALEAGFSAAGVNVTLAGPMPTSAIAYLTRTLHLTAGVVISASHNPFDDNGIKFFSEHGTKLPDALEAEIESLLDQPLQCVPSEKLGKAKRLRDAAGRYIEFCKSTFPNRLDLAGFKIVVDCAHGAAYDIAGSVFTELGAQTTVIAAEPDGFNINEGVGATHPDFLRQAVLQAGADIGFALDGDADRLIVVDHTGRLYNGDEILYVIAMQRHRARALEGVVGTLMSNMALEMAFSRHGIAFERAKVGDRYVHERLLEKGWHIGGESSGHLLCLDTHSTGDGIISALQLLLALRLAGKTLPALTQDLQLFPQVMKNVRLKPGYRWEQDTALQTGLQRAQAQLEGHGRVLVRASGTEPLLRIMVETANSSRSEAMAAELAASIIMD